MASKLKSEWLGGDPTPYFPRRALELFPDAAGGATSSKVKGWGCVCITLKEHAHGVWPRFILENKVRNGQTWGRRLSVLEGFGAAQCVTLWAKEIVRIGAAAIYVDNAGFVFACGNGTSRCEYVYTMAKYIADMSACSSLFFLMRTGTRDWTEQQAPVIFQRLSTIGSLGTAQNSSRNDGNYVDLASLFPIQQSL